jgi:phosphohistidine phosphatase
MHMSRGDGGETVRLYLVQHAEAKSEEEDPARPLSEKGLRDIDQILALLKARQIKVSRILHSGKLRAEQTAEKLATAITSLEGVKETDALAPLDDPDTWAARLKGEVEDVMLVGHLPHLSRLAGLLLSGNPDRVVIRFRMGGVVCLENENGGWAIHWIVTPQITE